MTFLHGRAVLDLERAHARQEQEFLHKSGAPVGVPSEQQVL